MIDPLFQSGRRSYSIILFSNLLLLSVPDEGLPRNASSALKLKFRLYYPSPCTFESKIIFIFFIFCLNLNNCSYSNYPFYYISMISNEYQTIFKSQTSCFFRFIYVCFVDCLVCLVVLSVCLFDF